MFALSRAMYLFDAKLNLLANTSAPVLHSTTQSRTSLPTAFAVGPLILQKEKYPCNTLQVGDVHRLMHAEPTL